MNNSFFIGSADGSKLPDLLHFSESPLIDAISVMDFEVTDIVDVSRLSQQGIASFNAHLRNSFRTSRGEKYTELKLSRQGLFDSLTYKLHADGRVYAYMNISIGDASYHNLFGYTIEQYLRRLDKIKDFMLEKFGVYIDFSMSRYHKMEIQKTFLLKDSCRFYQRPLVVLYKAFPDGLKLKGKAVYDSDPRSNKLDEYKQSFKRRSNPRGIEIAAYNKGE